jgi:hypothetical protein
MKAPGSIISEISENIKSLVSSQELADVVVGVGRFPGDNDGEIFSRMVPFSTLRNSTNINVISQ